MGRGRGWAYAYSSSIGTYPYLDNTLIIAVHSILVLQYPVEEQYYDCMQVDAKHT